jgi:hypothetical protein
LIQTRTPRKLALRVWQQISFFVTNESVGLDPLWAKQGSPNEKNFTAMHENVVASTQG